MNYALARAIIEAYCKDAGLTFNWEKFDIPVEELLTPLEYAMFKLSRRTLTEWVGRMDAKSYAHKVIRFIGENSV